MRTVALIFGGISLASMLYSLWTALMTLFATHAMVKELHDDLKRRQP